MKNTSLLSLWFSFALLAATTASGQPLVLGGGPYSTSTVGNAIDVRQNGGGYAAYLQQLNPNTTALVCESNAQTAWFKSQGLSSSSSQVSVTSEAICSDPGKQCKSFEAKVNGASGVGFFASIASRGADLRTTSATDYALYASNTNSSNAITSGSAILAVADGKRAIQASSVQTISIDTYSSLDTALYAHSGSRVGVDARSESGASVAVAATCWGTTGACSGVVAEAKGTFGGDGVQGRSTKAGRSGVFGENLVGFGVVGSSGPGAIGVYGVNSSAADYAGYFLGRVHVNGTLSKSAGSFRIDHPQFPDTKYLVHSFVESPDMMNVYNGVVVTDAVGEAWVALPSYFSTLNVQPRYQLTSIGVPSSLYIKSEVGADNRFQIAGGKPNQKVSWQVTGIRNDPYAQANRIVAEEDKAPANQGRYLHPELYGLPSSAAEVSGPNRSSPVTTSDQPK